MATATLGLLLTRLGRLNEQFLADHHRRHHCTSAEAAVLMLLANHDTQAVSPTFIGEWIVQTSGGLTATLRRLEQRGWIRRLPDPADGRGRLVTLTAAGTAAHDAQFEDLVETYRMVFAEVDAAAGLSAVRDLMRGFESLQGIASSAWWKHRADRNMTEPVEVGT
ncbi:MAG: MarR family transcriptional regulator [Actinomycetota bacterium]|jgi:DNA-binding MarR family transcriptional regulator|nr:MarR family transcriptional regulator [Actinomycetota bacterium]MEE2630803.1 MarR family transcriptional regulator [Actinomycetota bacterium]